MKTGLLGGSFDPIHNAHLAMAKAAYEQFGLDEVWFVPSGFSYHKGHQTASSQARCDMIQCAIRDIPHYRLSTVDIDRGGNTYTADTLRILKEEDPSRELYFVLGEDSLFQLENWYHPEQILENAVILAALRPGRYPEGAEEKIRDLKERFRADIRILDMPETDISSTEIRRKLAEGKSVRGLVPDAVADYLEENPVYQELPVPTVKELKKELKKLLSDHRYEHTLGVADTAKKLAEIFGEKKEKAYLAGLLHDCAKHYTEEELLNLCRMACLPVTEAEEASPFLLHAKLGAYYARERYHVQDEDILNAIRYHTTGRPAMSTLEKIVYVADYIEPGRKEAPHLKQIRKMAEQDLNQAVARIAQDTLDYLHKKDRAIDPASAKTLEYYTVYLKGDCSWNDPKK